MQSASLADVRAALCWSLMERSIKRRASYSNRASVIVAAAALLVTSVSFFLASRTSGYVVVRPWGIVVLLTCLASCLLSIIFGLFSIVYIGSGRRVRAVVESAGLPAQPFVSAKDTFSRYGVQGYAAFCAEFRQLSQVDLNRSLEAQLFVGLYFETTRVRHLRSSARLLILASGLLLIALLSTCHAQPTAVTRPLGASSQPTTHNGSNVPTLWPSLIPLARIWVEASNYHNQISVPARNDARSGQQ
jgi:hypothetical protein